MIEHSGGRAGVHEYGWVLADYNLNDIESLRQELLRQNNIGQIQKAMQKLGIRIRRDLLQIIKSYLFDSEGIAFTYPNYIAWRNLATKKVTIGNASFLIHEIAEVQELQQTQRETGFDFLGKKHEKLSRQGRKQWRSDFKHYYLLAHAKALEKEYKFVTEHINHYIDEDKLKISFLQAAAIDPTRRIKPGAKETQAAQHMFVEGVAMKEHHHYNAWYARANELIPLSKAMQRRLKYYKAEIRLTNLIILVKNRQIK